MRKLELRNPFPGAACLLAESLPSTQEEAKRLAALGTAGGFPPGSLVAAEEQGAGRGRFPERRWESEAGRNLLFTVFLDPGLSSLPALPLRIGLALCEAASALGEAGGPGLPRPPLLKWPNDLLLSGRKAAGILCESGPAGVFAGVGLNCNQVAFPPGLEGRATSLALELGREVDRWALLELVLMRIKERLEREDWREAVEERLWMRGEEVAFLPGLAARDGAGGPGAAAAAPAAGEAPVLGRLVGVDGSGALLLRLRGEAEARSFSAGELTGAPRPYKV